MMQWEYKVVVSPVLIDELNQFGKAGWELVAVIDVSVPGTYERRFYFKRPIYSGNDT